MNLLNLVEYLVSPNKLEQLFKVKDPGKQTESYLIYLKSTLTPDAEINYFTVEETDDAATYEKDGETYVQLLPYDLAIELIEDLHKKKLNALEIATWLIEYRGN